MKIIKKQSGVAFLLKKGDLLKIIDLKGSQVSDMVLFNLDDPREKISSGKSMDFEETLLFTTGNKLWSNRGNKMAAIVSDTNGRNDFLLAPCSSKTFEIMYGYTHEHPSCFSNLATHLKPYNIEPDDIPTAFNIFMNVQFTEDGKLSVQPPTTKPGDYLTIKALQNLIVGLTSCSAPDSNGGTFKEIGYEIQPLREL